jgi:hypothetical protein
MLLSTVNRLRGAHLSPYLRRGTGHIQGHGPAGQSALEFLAPKGRYHTRSAPSHCGTGRLALEMHLCRFTWASSARGATMSTSSAPRPESNQCQRQECMCSSADSAPKQENSEKKPCGRTVSRMIRSEAGTQGRASTNSSKSQSRRRPKAGDRHRGDKHRAPRVNRQLFQAMKTTGDLTAIPQGRKCPSALDPAGVARHPDDLRSRDLRRINALR